MALSAGRLDVPRRKDWLLPCQCATVRLRDCSGRTLAAMASRATELIEIVGNRRMLAIGLRGYIRQADFFEPNMAASTTVDDTELGQPNLLNASIEMPPQRVCLAAVADQDQVAILIMPPFAEEVFCRSDRYRDKKNYAHDAEGAHVVSEQFLPERRRFFVHDRPILIYGPCHGQTQDQPGPRKKVPMAV